jgi:tetracycline repressor-like protein
VELEGEFRGLLTGLVQRAVELGHLRDDLDVEQFAWELCGIYLGSKTRRARGEKT